MADENSLEKEVRNLQKHFGSFAKLVKDLNERVKSLESKGKYSEDKDIQEIIENQRVVDEILVSNSDAIKNLDKEIQKLKQEKEVDEIEMKKTCVDKNGDRVKDKKCRYFNRGHCKYRERCRFYHEREICQTYLENNKCDRKICRKRHPKVCKFWLRSNQGCKRGDECDFLHVTLAQGEQNVVNVNRVETSIYECAGCKDVWTDRTGVVEHMIGNHTAYFCLNCDDWIQQKWKVFEEGWTLKDGSGNLRRDV